LIRIVAAFTAREWAGSLTFVLAGVIYWWQVLILKHPVTAALALTLLFAALFLAVGVFRVIMSI